RGRARREAAAGRGRARRRGRRAQDHGTAGTGLHLPQAVTCGRPMARGATIAVLPQPFGHSPQMICQNIVEAIGNTPVVRLNRVAKDVAANIFVKCEFMNPGGSIKDRIGWWMIEDAEKRGV